MKGTAGQKEYSRNTDKAETPGRASAGDRLPALKKAGGKGKAGTLGNGLYKTVVSGGAGISEGQLGNENYSGDSGKARPERGGGEAESGKARAGQAYTLRYGCDIVPVFPGDRSYIQFPDQGQAYAARAAGPVQGKCPAAVRDDKH